MIFRLFNYFKYMDENTDLLMVGIRLPGKSRRPAMPAIPLRVANAAKSF
jgi:hypothetical protein